MYPLSSGSSHCHYNPERYSEANAIKISKEVGYKGLYSIEAGANNGSDPYTAVQTILDEVARNLAMPNSRMRPATCCEREATGSRRRESR